MWPISILLWLSLYSALKVGRGWSAAKVWVDNRLIGICNERSAYVVYDGTQENRLIKLADINKKDYSIAWNEGQSISIPQQRHIIDMRREIKDRIV